MSLPSAIPVAYDRVDHTPEPGALVAAMDSTGRWPSVRNLRAWERSQLAVRSGEDLLDVGCGTGDAAIAYAGAVAPEGSVTGIDLSEVMLDEARRRARAAGVDARFTVGDAAHLPRFRLFDAVRCERTLQWVPDPDATFAGLVGLLRPGGRLGVIDTDWRTLAIDHPDPAAWEAVREGLLMAHRPGADVGGRLLNLARGFGLVDIGIEVATHVWTVWNPDQAPSPDAFLPVRPLADGLVAAHLIDGSQARRFVGGLERAARRDRLFMSVTMVAVAGCLRARARRPAR